MSSGANPRRPTRPIALLLSLALAGALGGCSFDSTVTPVPTVGVPVAICDPQPSDPACPFLRGELAWIAHFGELEGIDGTIGAGPNGAQPVAGAGCLFQGALPIPEPLLLDNPRLLALDEDEWVADCRPDFLSIDANGEPVIEGTAVFRRGMPGCEIRTANFCG